MVIPPDVKPESKYHANALSRSTCDFSMVLASSVHDMKNSIARLLGTLSAMIESSPPADALQAKHYSVLEYETARINDELVQLLWLYRMDEQKMLVVIEEHCVADSIEEQLARNKTLLSTKGIETHLDCGDDLLWWYDRELIGSVLNNLIVNCANYSQAQLHIGVQIKGRFLCISVADDGPGYPENLITSEDIISSVPFRSGGPQLGLLFGRRVLALHKSAVDEGYLRIENNGPLGGGVITIFLP